MTIPPWIKKKVFNSSEVFLTENILKENDLTTVCQEAMCPNRGECFSLHTATFMILGDTCTRNCRFCAVKKGVPKQVDLNEPEKIVDAAKILKLKHVVVTSVTRDDLNDQGATQFVRVIEKLKCQGFSVEVLIPDFRGDFDLLKIVINAMPDIINHNLETVPRLYPTVRPQADYFRSLSLLKKVKQIAPDIFTKSGIMVGLGEQDEEIFQVIKDLRKCGCDALTIGQYLRPSGNHLPVKEYVPLEKFEKYKEFAYNEGFLDVASGPFIRSSYKGKQCLEILKKKKLS